MDLKEFVSQTLTQIMDAVREAQAASEHGGVVNPTLQHYGKISDSYQSLDGDILQMVEFDVALTVDSSTNTKGAIGVATGFLNLGSSGQSASQNSSVSRVRFQVPVVLPTPPKKAAQLGTR